MIVLKMSEKLHDSFRDVRETVMIFLEMSDNCHDSFKDVR